MSGEVLFPIDMLFSEINCRTRDGVLLVSFLLVINSIFFKFIIVIYLSMVFWDLSMVTQFPILILWFYGKLNLVILQMELRP